MIDTISMYLTYVKITIKSWFQYKLDACLRSFAVFVREGASILIIYLSLLSFDFLNGWNTMELFFLYSLVYLTYAILILFFTGLRDFDYIVNGGAFDRFLLRPRGVLFQVLSANSDWFAAIGHGSLGIILLIYTSSRIDVYWSFGNILYLICAVIGGVLLQGAIFLFIATLSFFLLKVGNFRNFLFQNPRSFAGYPISIYPKFIQVFLLYIVPFAFVNYFPVQFLIRKEDSILYPAVFMYIAPLVGVVLYVLAFLFWRWGVKHYKSSGN